MGASGSNVHGMDETGPDYHQYHEIRDTSGAVVGGIDLYETRAADGAVRAQLELRFEDKSSAIMSAGHWLEPQRYADRWTGIVVEVEPRQSLTDPVRFGIYIPGQAGATGNNVRDAETTATAIGRTREAIQALREGCGDPNCRDNFLRTVAALRT